MTNSTTSQMLLWRSIGLVFAGEGILEKEHEDK